MSEQVNRKRPHHGGPMGGPPGAPGEKAKDFKGTLGKLLRYMGNYKYAVLVVMIFAIGGTAFNIIGPKILSKATTELFNGLMAKLKNRWDRFYQNRKDSAVFAGTVCAECIAFLCAGIPDDRDCPEAVLPFPKRDLGEDQPYAHGLF